MKIEIAGGRKKGVREGGREKRKDAMTTTIQVKKGGNGRQIDYQRHCILYSVTQNEKPKSGM